MASFQKVASVGDIAQGKMKEYQVNGKTIVLALTDGEYLAFDGVCTHAHCALAGGFLDGYTLTCYCHGGMFDVKTGEVLSPPPESPVNVYKVKVEDNSILVEI